MPHALIIRDDCLVAAFSFLTAAVFTAALRGSFLSEFPQVHAELRSAEIR